MNDIQTDDFEYKDKNNYLAALLVVIFIALLGQRREVVGSFRLNVFSINFLIDFIGFEIYKSW